MNTSVLDLETMTIADFLVNGNETGRTVLLTGVSWEQYERLTDEAMDKTNLSFAYDGGRLEIMSKSPKHEDYSRSIYNFVLAYSEILDLTIESRGTTTFKRSAFKKGVEPDECFYVQNVEAVIGANDLDVSIFPAPDLAIEIDLTTESLDKFPIYAALQVSELWIYDGSVVRFYELAGADYDEIETSRSFPLLTARTLTEFLEKSRSRGQTAALKSFREWLRNQNS